MKPSVSDSVARESEDTHSFRAILPPTSLGDVLAIQATSLEWVHMVCAKKTC